MINNRHVELAIAAKKAQPKPNIKPKMQKLGSTLGDLVKLKRQDVDATESRETNNRS